jgi:hypothetical protein
MKNQSPLLIGLLHPLNLAMLALAFTAGMCAAWWLFPIGLLLWVIMVVMVARNPTLQIRHDIISRAPLTQRYQEQYKDIERVQVRIYNLLTSSHSSTQREFRSVLSAVNELVDNSYLLCQRMGGLENYRLVSQKKTVEIEEELIDLDEKIARATDPYVQNEYEESRAALERRVAKVNQINLQLDRADAQLTGVRDTLDNVHTEILRIQALGKKTIKEERTELINTIQSQTEQIKNFSIDEDENF